MFKIEHLTKIGEEEIEPGWYATVDGLFYPDCFSSREEATKFAKSEEEIGGPHAVVGVRHVISQEVYSGLNIDTAKSYATEENLMKALVKLGFDKSAPLVVRNRAGRYTAVFGFHLSGMAQEGDIARFARHGFKTID